MRALSIIGTVLGVIIAVSAPAPQGLVIAVLTAGMMISLALLHTARQVTLGRGRPGHVTPDDPLSTDGIEDADLREAVERFKVGLR